MVATLQRYNAHPALVQAARDVQLLYDALAGETYIKGLYYPYERPSGLLFEGAHNLGKWGLNYLPQYRDVSDETYEDMVQLGMWADFTADTLQDMAARVFRLPSQYALPAAVEQALVDHGCSVEDIARRVFWSVAGLGRCVVLVDPMGYPHDDLIRFYETYDCVNWGHTADQRPFAVLRDCQYRADPATLRQARSEMFTTLIGFGDQGTEVTTGAADDLEGDRRTLPRSQYTVPPTAQPLSLVPITPKGVDYRPDCLPLIGIARLNLLHYRLNTALTYKMVTGQHAFRLLAGEGASEVKSEVPASAGSIYRSSNPNTSASIIEESGHMVEHLAAYLENVETLLRSQGAVSYDDSRRQPETATAVLEHQRATTTRIQMILNGCEPGVKRILLTAAQALGFDLREEAIEFAYNRDLLTVSLTPDEIRSRLDAFREGALDESQLMQILIDGEVVPRPDAA